jgi:hypothetical protein
VQRLHRFGQYHGLGPPAAQQHLDAFGAHQGGDCPVATAPLMAGLAGLSAAAVARLLRARPPSATTATAAGAPRHRSWRTGSTSGRGRPRDCARFDSTDGLLIAMCP